MHIVQISPVFVSGDGTGNVAWARAAALVRAGHQVEVICSRVSMPVTPYRPKIHVIEARGRFALKDAPQHVARSIATADLLVLDYCGDSPLFSVVANRGGKLVIDFHGLTPAYLLNTPSYSVDFMRAVARLRSFGDVDLLITHSHFIRSEFHRLIGYLPSRTEVVPLFGRTINATPPALAERDHRKPLSLLCVGRYFPNKNYEVALQSLAVFRKQGIPARLEHVGAGIGPIPSAYRARIQVLVDSLEIGDLARFSGTVPQDYLERAYANCDAVIIPSLHEGFSLPALEALAFGKPVFASNLAAIPETLDDAGIYFNPFDPAELVDKVRSYFDQDLSTRRQLRQRAIDRAAQFSESRFQTEEVRLLEALAAENSGGGGRSPAISHPSVVLDAQWDEPDGASLRGSATVHCANGTLSTQARLVAHLMDQDGNFSQYDVPLPQTWQPAPNHETRQGYQVAFQLRSAAVLPSTRLDLLLSDVIRGEQFFLTSPCHLPLPPAVQDKSLPPRDANWHAMIASCSNVDLAVSYPLEPPKRQFWLWLQTKIARRILDLVYYFFLKPQSEMQAEFNRALLPLLPQYDPRSNLAGEQTGHLATSHSGIASPSIAKSDSNDLSTTPDNQHQSERRHE